MAPLTADIISSDEDDAPESFSLVQSKQHIKKRDDELKKIQTAEKDKKRAFNRERDRRLKEQAENSKRKRNEDKKGGTELVARMEWAMQEAQAEMDEEEEDEDDDGDDEDEDEFVGIKISSDDEADDGDGDEQMDSSDAESSQARAKSKIHPNHLPDHLFTSAFNSQTTKLTSKRKASEDGPKFRSKKRARSTASPKNVIIGARAIRTLKQGGPPSAAGIMPSSKVKKFLDRSLGLKGGNTRTRGWERKPANIGVMRRNGPAASFVRSR